jgi:hypothetical protein
MTMPRESKYELLYVLQGSYGHGWEDLTESTDRKEVLQDLKSYRENEGGSYRIIHRKVLKPGFTAKSTPVRYKIIKFRQNGAPTSVRGMTNLTEAEAQKYCSREDTHGKGWFCGYTKM